MKRYALSWGTATALEATLDEVAKHAKLLSFGYNEPRNAELMGHTFAISPDEVVDSYREGIAAGMRAFLLFDAGALAGDGDLRGVRNGTAEFAFMIAMPEAQGKGLGTRFATMIEKLGYVVDDSPAAREYADEPGDVTLALDRATFEQRTAGALPHIKIEVR